jgi:hypothetical protein
MPNLIAILLVSLSHGAFAGPEGVRRAKPLHLLGMSWRARPDP